MQSHLAVGALLVLAASAAVSSQQPAGYAVRTSLALTPGPDHVRGRIELLEDARIRPEMREAIRQAWGGDPCAGQADPVLAPLCSDTERARLRPALLRLIDPNHRVVAIDTLERPIAELSRTRLYDTARRTYLLTVDLSAGIGSYSGPYTRLAEPTAHGFGWLVAADSADARRDTITLVTTLKSGWRRVPRSEGKGIDLLMVRCRPDLSSPPTDSARFILTFVRFTFVNGQWTVRRRQEPGCWENDDDSSFPDESRFPPQASTRSVR